MVFKAECDDTVELYCGQHTIQKVDNCLYLGVFIDKELKCKLIVH